MLRLKVVFVLAGLIVLLSLGAAPSQAATGDPQINEIRIDHTGDPDINEYFELAGTPGASLDRLMYVVIGDGSSTLGSGVIEYALDLTGHTIPADGFFVVAKSTFTLGIPDLITSQSFENSDNVTHLLVRDYTGTTGMDLDTNNDGVLDITPWTELVDLIALVEEPNPPSFTEYHYGPPAVGPDGTFVPGHAFRCPDETGEWTIGPFSMAPGVGKDSPGAPNICAAPPPTVLTISEIQGSAQFSPWVGERVQTSGVVTAYTANGAHFWLQDPVGDSDPATSEGIFVSGGGNVSGSPHPAVGDYVTVVARVEEQQFAPALPLTRLVGVQTVAIESSGNPLPLPVLVSDLPDESLTDGIAFWEPLEGMLVSVVEANVVMATNNFGEFGMIAEADAVPGSGYFPQTGQLIIRSTGENAVDYNPERILVDDSTLSAPIFVSVRDEVHNFTGVVDYTFGMFKLQPVSWEATVHNLPHAPASHRSGGRGNTTITSFNVENLFDLVDDPAKEDEGTTPTPADLEAKLNKLVLAAVLELELPEIMVIEEVENQAILQVLGDRINAAAGTNYVAVSFESSDVRGIEVGFLYDADRVTLLSAFQLSDAIVPGVSAAFGPGSASAGREPLVGVFEIEGQVVTIIGNHFKSKGGDNALFGVNQPPIRVTEEQRKLQARVVRDYVNLLLAADPNALIIVAGDLNDFQFGEPGEGADDPVSILAGSGGEVPLTNLILTEKPAEMWTYVFEGNSQVLDHMLVSPAVLDHFVALDVLHFNTPYADALVTDPSSPLHVSDHDPVEGRFEFGE